MRTKIVLAILLLLGLAGLGVRLPTALREPLWRDEAQAVAIARRTFPGGILEGVRHDGNSPLFYLLEHFVVAPQGARARELRDRALALLCGLALIPLCYAAARRLAARPGQGDGAEAGLAAAALVAFSPLAIDLATQVRMYSGVAAGAAALCWAAGGATERPGARAWATYAAIALALLYLHATSLTLIVGVAMVTLALVVRRRDLRAGWLVAHLSIAIGFVPGWLLARATVQIVGARLPWGNVPSLASLRLGAAWALTGLDGDAGAPVDGWVAAAAGVAAGLVVLGALAQKARAAVPAGAAALAFLLAYLSAQRTAAFLVRYSVGAVTLLAIAAGIGLSTLADRRAPYGRIAAAAGLALILGVQLRSLRVDRPKLRSAARAAAQLVQARLRPGDLVVTLPDSTAPGFNYYFPRGPEQLDLPELERVEAIDWQGWADRLSNPVLAQRLADKVQAAAADGRTLWVVCWSALRVAHPARDPNQLNFKHWVMAQRAFAAIDRAYELREGPFPLPTAAESFFVARYESRLTREP
ncbi:MAG TPA: hypothetical protein VKN99_04315 [Polyangia bacterium]|nr:hypothetical protein [Polyangia bacterium]